MHIMTMELMKLHYHDSIVCQKPGMKKYIFLSRQPGGKIESCYIKSPIPFTTSRYPTSELLTWLVGGFNRRYIISQTKNVKKRKKIKIAGRTKKVSQKRIEAVSEGEGRMGVNRDDRARM